MPAGRSLAEVIEHELDVHMRQLLAGPKDLLHQGAAWGLAYSLGVIRQPYEDRHAATGVQWHASIERVKEQDDDPAPEDPTADD